MGAVKALTDRVEGARPDVAVDDTERTDGEGGEVADASLAGICLIAQSVTPGATRRSSRQGLELVELWFIAPRFGFGWSSCRQAGGTTIPQAPRHR
jgi:hypothetical protein